MKKQIAGFISYKQHAWETDGVNCLHFYAYEMTENGYATVMPYTIEFDLPDDFNPIPAQVKALEAKRLELQAKFAKELMEIEASISKLTCITMEAV